MKLRKNIIIFSLTLLTPLVGMAGEGFEIKRLFESSSSYTKVIIETDKPRKVKCAVYDSQENPIRVDTQVITPPLDELLLRTGDKTKAVSTVKCWEIK